MKIKELAADDDLAAFCSGNDRLDEWLKKHAIKNQERGFGPTHLALDDDGTIVGLVSTSAASVERARVKRGQGPERWPALLIGRMATSKDRQRGGIGRRLLLHAFVVADAQYKLSGCAAVIVDAKPNAVGYYRQFGFKDLLSLPEDPPREEMSPTRMYVSIGTVHNAIAEAAKLDATTSAATEAATPAALEEPPGVTF